MSRETALSNHFLASGEVQALQPPTNECTEDAYIRTLLPFPAPPRRVPMSVTTSSDQKLVELEQHQLKLERRLMSVEHELRLVLEELQYPKQISSSCVQAGWPASSVPPYAEQAALDGTGQDHLLYQDVNYSAAFDFPGCGVHQSPSQGGAKQETTGQEATKDVAAGISHHDEQSVLRDLALKAVTCSPGSSRSTSLTFAASFSPTSALRDPNSIPRPTSSRARCPRSSTPKATSFKSMLARPDIATGTQAVYAIPRVSTCIEAAVQWEQADPPRGHHIALRDWPQHWKRTNAFYYRAHVYRGYQVAGYDWPTFFEMFGNDGIREAARNVRAYLGQRGITNYLPITIA